MSADVGDYIASLARCEAGDVADHDVAALQGQRDREEWRRPPKRLRVKVAGVWVPMRRVRARRWFTLAAERLAS